MIDELKKTRNKHTTDSVNSEKRKEATNEI